MIEIAVRTAVQAIPGMSARIGTRVYPQQLPQNVTIPAVTYGFFLLPDLTYKGRSSERQARFHYDFHGIKYLDARNAAKLLEDAAEILPGIYDDIEITAVNILDVRPNDVPDTVPGLSLHVVRVEMSVWYKEA